MLTTKRTGNFELTLTKIVNEDPTLLPLIKEKIKIFLKNPDDTRLENHQLKGRMEGKWAFSITDDIRIVYEWLGKTSIRFLGIGHHNEVYKKN